jgi:hypothetical protein
LQLALARNPIATNLFLEDRPMTAQHARVWEAHRILIRCSGTLTMDLRRQLMLIYLADRECWAQLGQPLIAGPILATYQYGPVNAAAVKALKGRAPDDFVFRELSKAEAKILQRISIANQYLSTDELLDRACELPEWRPPLLVGGDVIPLEKVLAAVGYSPEDAHVIAEGHDSLAMAPLATRPAEIAVAVA